MPDYEPNKSKRVQVILEESQIDLLKDLAKENGWSFSHVLRVTIERQRDEILAATKQQKRKNARAEWRETN